MAIDKASTFCPLPWISLNTRSNGDLRLCCQANVSTGRGILRDERGLALNAGRIDLAETQNSALLKEVRKSMARGEWHSACMRCEREEKAGLVSRRSYETQKWREICPEPEALSQIDSEGRLTGPLPPVVSLDIRFGNKCNLKCRMCSPMDSSSWYEDWYQLFGDHYQDSDQKVLLRPRQGRMQAETQQYDWYEADDFWQRWEPILNRVEFIQTVGGEPLLIDRYYEFLERLVNMGRAPHVTIESNSNMTVIPEKAWALWRHFKAVRFGASLDGVGKVNDYIRHPSKFSNIERNLHRLDQADGNFELWLTNTIQVYNLWNFPDLVRWKIASGFRRINSRGTRPLLTPHILHRPEFFNIRILPVPVKQQVARHLLDFTDQLERPEHRQDYAKMVAGFIAYMNAEDWSHLIPKFWAITRGLDRLRGEGFAKACPEMYSLLEPYFQTAECEKYVLRRSTDHHPS